MTGDNSQKALFFKKNGIFISALHINYTFFATRQELEKLIGKGMEELWAENQSQATGQQSVRKQWKWMISSWWNRMLRVIA